MSISKWLVGATLIGIIVAGSACSEKDGDETTKEAVDKAVEATKEAGEKVADDAKDAVQKTGEKTKEIAEKTADKTKEVAGEIVDKSKEIVSATGEKITDGWITTKLNAKFVDETVLKDSKINVDTNNHVVTLKGTVTSDAAKTRAASIARGTEGVKSVVNQLVVKTR